MAMGPNSGSHNPASAPGSAAGWVIWPSTFSVAWAPTPSFVLSHGGLKIRDPALPFRAPYLPPTFTEPAPSCFLPSLLCHPSHNLPFPHRMAVMVAFSSRETAKNQFTFPGTPQVVRSSKIKSHFGLVTSSRHLFKISNLQNL